MVEVLDDGVLAYDLRTDEIHALDPVVGALWDEADGVSTLAEIATRLGLDAEVAEVYAADLAARDLITLDEAGAAGALSRRAFGKRAALVAGGVVGLSVISTISAPLPAAAASTIVVDPEPQCCRLACGELAEGSISFDLGVFYDLDDDSLPAGLTCMSSAADLCAQLPGPTSQDALACNLTTQFQLVPCGSDFDFDC